MSLVQFDDMYTAEKIIGILKSDEMIERYKSENINSVILFGSIVRDDFEDYSDVDIAILSQSKISLNHIMELEEIIRDIVKREVDIIDLGNDELDLRFKVSVYDNSMVIYNDELDLYGRDYEKTDMIYKNNEEFRFFRERDVIFDE